MNNIYELFGSNQTPNYVDNWTFNTTVYSNYNYNTGYLTNG